MSIFQVKNTPTHYATYDNNPTEGDNTYRIKATNNDGSVTLSEAKTVVFKGLSEVRVFPNPANDVLSLDLSNYKNQDVEVYLYNYLGQPVLTKQVEKVSNTVIELNIADQPVGNYMIRVKSKNKRDGVKPVVIAH